MTKLFSLQKAFFTVTYSRLITKSEVWESQNEWRDGLENLRELHEAQWKDWKSSCSLHEW